MSIWVAPEKRKDKKDAPLYNREEVEAAIPKIQKYIEEFNSREDEPCKITTAFLFGSYVAGKELVHDLDVAIVIEGEKRIPIGQWVSSNDPDQSNGSNLVDKRLIEREVHRSAGKFVEVHFIDRQMRNMVNFSLLNPVCTSMRGRDENDENQPYVFSGQNKIIYPIDDALRLKMGFQFGCFSYDGANFTGTFSYKIFGFLGVGYCFGYVETDVLEENKQVRVTNVGRVAGFDYTLIGLTDESLARNIEYSLQDHPDLLER